MNGESLFHEQGNESRLPPVPVEPALTASMTKGQAEFDGRRGGGRLARLPWPIGQDTAALGWVDGNLGNAARRGAFAVHQGRQVLESLDLH